MIPPIVKEKHNQLFFSLKLIDKKDNTIFVDLTGKFPLRSVMDILQYLSSMIGRAMRSYQPQARMQNMSQWSKHLQKTSNIYQYVGSNRNITSWTIWHQKQFGRTSRKEKNSNSTNRTIIVPTQANVPYKLSKTI